MGCADTLPGTHTETSSSERVRYFPRQLLTADDMRIEQEYFREKQRRHNRFLHGWGVVCGLEVRADAEAGPLAVRICPGYALGPQGDEIHVPSVVPFDLHECARRPADPCAPVSSRAAVAVPDVVLAIQIRYAECPTRPVRTLPAGCGCDDTACEYSRVRDGFEIRCAVKPAEQRSGPGQPTLCEIEKSKGHLMPACPPAADCWVELATVTIKGPATSAGALAITDAAINNGTRRLVYSAAMVQEQLIRCCCGR